jgi:hypothetical protein
MLKKPSASNTFSLVEDKLTKTTVIFADNAGIFDTQITDFLNYVRNSGKY